MKNALLRTSFALLASLAPLACESPDKGSSTGSNITTAGDQIALAAGQLDSTVAALHDLTDRPAPDLTKQRSAYESALGSLESTITQIGATTDKMRAEGNAYFAEWDEQIKSIQNEDIREDSMDRRKAIEASLTKAQGKYGDVKSDLDHVLQDLRDVRTALKADLTMAGIESIKKSTVKDVDKSAKSVSSDMREVAQKFHDVGVQLSRKGPPEAAAK